MVCEVEKHNSTADDMDEAVGRLLYLVDSTLDTLVQLAEAEMLATLALCYFQSGDVELSAGSLLASGPFSPPHWSSVVESQDRCFGGVSRRAPRAWL